MASSLVPALAAVGRSEADVVRHPVLHGNGETLVTFGRPAADGGLLWSGVWITPSGLQFLGVPAESHGASRSHRLTGPAAQLFDTIVDVARNYLERIEELDQQLSEAQQRGRTVPLPDVWRLQRRAALLRAQIGRSLVALAELAGPFGAAFPGLSAALPSLEGELGRVQQLCANLQQSLSDLILLRNAEESNRIAEAANRLSKVSNRIAALANISNIRMLGLTYIALLLGLVSAVVLFPNTAATILGMPSASWVPGVVVDLVLVTTAMVPLALVLRPRWVRTILAGLPAYEARASEGVRDLPEMEPDVPSGEPPRESQRL
ncbi:MAG TPA: hypothetical protein VFG07_07430 [Thermoplasmata archaeon]|nr:hypothetical protein [Thermoplasmata archaeon]